MDCKELADGIGKLQDTTSSLKQIAESIDTMATSIEKIDPTQSKELREYSAKIKAVADGQTEGWTNLSFCTSIRSMWSK